MNFLCDIFTLFWFTIAYCMVVSICTWPNSLWTCSIGIPLSIAFVAIVLLNLCRCIFLISASLPRLRILFSTPGISNRLWGFLSDTNSAGSSSFLDSKYFWRWILIYNFKWLRLNTTILKIQIENKKIKIMDKQLFTHLFNFSCKKNCQTNSNTPSNN